MSSQPTEIPRPIPRPSVDSAPYFKAAADGRLDVTQCANCGAFIWQPQQMCPSCLSDNVKWTTLSGAGTVFTYIVVGRPVHPWFATRVPYVLALVEFEDAPGIRIMADVLGDPEKVAFGSKVQATFERISDELGLVHFQLA